VTYCPALLLCNKKACSFYFNVPQLAVFAKEILKPPDGVLITFQTGWSQFRFSDTQPIFAVVAQANIFGSVTPSPSFKLDRLLCCELLGLDFESETFGVAS
jgi:hypothetical protein